jgi:hypothetical protein
VTIDKKFNYLINDRIQENSMSKKFDPSLKTWLVIGAVIAVIIYFLGIRRWQEPGGMAQVEIVFDHHRMCHE